MPISISFPDRDAPGFQAKRTYDNYHEADWRRFNAMCEAAFDIVDIVVRLESYIDGD